MLDLPSGIITTRDIRIILYQSYTCEDVIDKVIASYASGDTSLYAELLKLKPTMRDDKLIQKYAIKYEIFELLNHDDSLLRDQMRWIVQYDAVQSLYRISNVRGIDSYLGEFLRAWTLNEGISISMFRQFMSIYGVTDHIGIDAFDIWLSQQPDEVMTFVIANMTTPEIMENCMAFIDHAFIVAKHHNVIDIVKQVIFNPNEIWESFVLMCVMVNTQRLRSLEHAVFEATKDTDIQIAIHDCILREPYIVRRSQLYSIIAKDAELMQHLGFSMLD